MEKNGTEEISVDTDSDTVNDTENTLNMNLQETSQKPSRKKKDGDQENHPENPACKREEELHRSPKGTKLLQEGRSNLQEQVQNARQVKRRVSPCHNIDHDLTVALIGSPGALQVRDGNLLLEPAHFHQQHSDISNLVPRSRNIFGRHVSIFNILGLHDTDLHQDSDSLLGQVISENKIHVFLYVLPLGQLTDEDKMGLDWLQRTFGERSLDFVMIIFTYETEDQCDSIIDDLKKNSVLEKIVQKCGGRYHTCSKSMNNQSEMRTLLEKIDRLVSGNKEHCQSAELSSSSELKMEGKSEEDSKVLNQRGCQSPYTGYGVHSPDDKTRTDERREDTEGEGKGGCSGRREITGNSSETDDPGGAKIQQLMNRLNLTDKLHNELTTADVLQISSSSSQCPEPRTENELAYSFLQRLLMMDYRARYITIRVSTSDSHYSGVRIADEKEEDAFDALFKKKAHNVTKTQGNIHPMDVQMAVFHCADRFLQQFMVTKLSQCQYALPLLVPNPFTQYIEFPLWTFRQIKKSWKSTDKSGKVTSQTKPIYKAETPMVSFFRFGSVSSSKSQLMNSLINEKHNTFFHRHCPGSSKTRLLMDGVVEIAWYVPSGKDTDHFPDCVAFCNLHGDAEANDKQREILTKMATVNVALLPSLSKADKSMAIVQTLFDSQKPLICLLSEDDSAITEIRQGKYRIGIKDRNQSDVSTELRNIIKQIVPVTAKDLLFKVENIAKYEGIKVDEHDNDYQKGKKASKQILALVKGKELPKIKEKYLPCQGKLWNDWCQKNKDLYRLQGNLEIQKSIIKSEMNQIRKQQHACAFSKLMELFVDGLHSLEGKEKVYFLKWIVVLLDNVTSDDLSALHQSYDEKWTKVLQLKKQHDKSDQLRKEQKYLEKISDKLNEATFGLEHILREMGQIYESYASVENDKEHQHIKFSSLPRLAAELMISGHPVEMMDGDAAHVPLIWVTAVLDEVIKRLGDQRVFVLSVLGIQSTGKSTMLNAMFGLQFAVSAGRCTRGAFMQLVRITEEMKEELKFDYILVVDTEGLRALELAGRSTRHHDNELATFVVGLGNMTLINIFGENPAEMQDVLQIVVQAFLRMKKVRLSPSCMFVHQNVGDITAGEKNMEGRRRLQEKLDEMTQLAAKEEDCDVECFSDVIGFDVQTDVKYFAQLWEGSPPMAPPNPSYSDNIQELKRGILSRSSKFTGMTLSQFKTTICDLWNALLNENFVFSFKNTLEIAVYRKLETQYGKWTWSLRSAMLHIEDRLLNRIANGKLLKVEEKELVVSMRQTKEEVENSMKQYFERERDKEILIQWRGRFESKIRDLHNELVKGTKRKLDELIQQKKACEKLDEKKVQYENKLFEQSKKLALSVKNKEYDNDILSQKFDEVWSKWVTDLTEDTPSVRDIDVWEDVKKILDESYELSLVCERLEKNDYNSLPSLGDYSGYIVLNKHKALMCEDTHSKEVDNTTERKERESSGSTIWSNVKSLFRSKSLNKKQSVNHLEHQHKHQSKQNILTFEDQDSIRALINKTMKHVEMNLLQKPIAKQGYNYSYIQEMTNSVKQRVEAHESQSPGYLFKKEFTVDLSLCVCNIAAPKIMTLQNEFRNSNDPRLYLEKQKPQYYGVFKSFCKGATSTAVFGKFICSKLEPSILQAVYDKTAIDVAHEMKSNVSAFNGNRSNLEKHILRSLAEEENFEKFMTYIHNPEKHFKHFITEEVSKYILKENNQIVLGIIIGNLKHKQQRVINAVHSATEEVKNNSGDANMWLSSFSDKIKDELKFTEDSDIDLKEITDFSFLETKIKQNLTDTIKKLDRDLRKSPLKMEMFRERPDEILIKHFCQCCWVQCPFCKAICTNTIEGHTGDHSVPFHRSKAIDGWHYIGTTEFSIDFCTTSVASENRFRPSPKSDERIPYKEYRKAGGKYANWSITPDLSQLQYWKWFVCRFKNSLEKHYNLTFLSRGEIPSEWKNYTKADAIESLDMYI